jgi:hypothetical protein
VDVRHRRVETGVTRLLAISVAAVLAVLVLDLAASVGVLRSAVLTGRQKAAQLFVVWALPILGAFLALQIARESRAKPLKPGSLESGPEPGIALSGHVSGAPHDSSFHGHS